MKFKRSSFLAKVVVLVLLVFTAITLLQDNIENSNDPDTVLAVAKDKLGLLESGEVIFYDTTN